MAARIDDMKQIGPAADLAVRRLVDMESARILGLDPALTLEAKVQAVIDYMNGQGLTVQAQQDGIRDYLMHLLNDAEGLPAAFPSSVSPCFPDSWITPEVLTPVNKGRAWFVLL